MKERIARLRQQSFEAEPSISTERAELLTRFYREHEGRHPVPVMRALSFKDLCEKKTLYIGDGELIVGERGPAPKVVPTFPELTCHTVTDLETLDAREQTRYAIEPGATDIYEEEIIPYWRGRSMRDRVFSHVPQRWNDAYEAGVFTEFMEQRAPGHTALDGEIYQTGMLDYKDSIRARLERLDYLADADATRKG